MITMERGKYYMGGKVEGLQLPTRVFPCATPAGALSCCAVRSGQSGHPVNPAAERVMLPSSRYLLCIMPCLLPTACAHPPAHDACCPPPAPTHPLTTPATHCFRPVLPRPPPADVRSTLPEGVDVLAFQCRNPIHRAHYELFIRALDAPNVSSEAVCLVHPTCGPTQVGWRAGG